MTEEQVHKQEFLVRDLSTSSVTFFPARANIVRDIRDVALKHGPNEITIYGLTPTADENSIKVDGTGAATITDMVVELVPNRDRYEDVYPSDSEDESEIESDNESDAETETIKSLREEEENVIQAMQKVQEEKASASNILKFLDCYGKENHKDGPAELADRLSMYQKERKKAFAEYHASDVENTNLLKQRNEISKKMKKAVDKVSKSKVKDTKAKDKEKERKDREKTKKLQAKREQKVDRIKFWPKKVYKVTISIDALLELTPASSRRGSFSSLSKTADSSDACHITLSLSYISSAAAWAPRYDLSLHTPTSTGSVLYRAEFTNTTSETWKDAKIILSTSQTAFQGLGEEIPKLQPWHIDLTKISFGSNKGVGPIWSNHEYQHQHTRISAFAQKPEPPRESLFGVDNIDTQTMQILQQQNNLNVQRMQRHNALVAPNNKAQWPGAGLFGSSTAPSQKPQQAPMQGFGAPAPTGGGLFGSSSNNNPTAGGVFASRSVARGRNAEPRASAKPLSDEIVEEEEEEEEAEGPGGDDTTMIADLPSLDTLESSMQESGLTVTYELPGLRTVPPSFTVRRHKIATISLKDLQLSHLIVPKLRTAAFLKARIRNNSSISLLRGPAGVTLDGSFLGNTALPRCSAGETFGLSLGADPSVSVVYGKPTVHKSQSGILSKESSSIYTRTCTVTNTKANRIIEGSILDQVPVSNEERLKVEVLHPRGMRREGDSVRSGTGITMAGKDDLKWGKATASLKKAGEIRFDFKIEGGKGARFVIEYETKHPSTEQVMNV